MANFNSEHPLRPYYVRPAPEDLVSNTSFGAPSSSSSSPSISASNRYSKIDNIIDLDHDESSKQGKTLLAGWLFAFASTGLVQPFQVAQTCLQVQWMPRQDAAHEMQALFVQDDQDVPQPEEELSDEADGDAYFSDLSSRPPSRFPANWQASQATPARDRAGYIQRTSVYDPATKPDWIVTLSGGGVWDMMRALGRGKAEGWLSLWKGQATSFVIDLITGAIQPFFLSLLTSAFVPPSALPSLPLIHSPYPAVPLIIHVSSHFLANFIVSPLELVRTRLIVQSRRHKSYSNPVHALSRISAEEGGLKSMYLHPNLLLPTLVETTIRPLLQLSSPLIIERILNVSSTDNLWAYSLAEFALGTASLLITLPIETIRQRLQVQSRALTKSSFKACVELRPVPYAGMVECGYRILTEETSRPLLPARMRRNPKKGDDQTPPSSSFGGLRQLYRGFSLGITAQTIMLVLSLMGGRDTSAAWAEL